MEVRTRFAPSPTGFLHIGGLRTALYSYALAKRVKGKFILRVEDTDRKRYVPEAVENLIKILKLFGLDWDEGPVVGGLFAPYIQSERAKTGIYKKYAEKLVKDGHAYYCFCPVRSKQEIEEERKKKGVELRNPCRNLSKNQIDEKLKSGLIPSIRLKVPDGEQVSFNDFVIRKEITWKTDDVDEVMLLKSDGFPTYHLAVVIDDAVMGITHIARALEWLPSTPVHLLLFKYLNFKIPEIGHMSDILDPSGGKLSKRKGSVTCEEFLSEGYLPEAILNFIMLLGWAPKDNRELFSLKEFVKAFNPEGLQKANPIFNRVKLDWFNGYYIRQLKVNELNSKFIIHNSQFKTLEKSKQLSITKLIQDRIKKINDLDQLAGFFFERPKVDRNLLGKKSPDHLSAAEAALGKINNWTKEEIDKSLLDLVKEKDFKTGDFFMDLRIAICGSKFTPPINDSIMILGKEETLARLKELVKDY